MTDDEKRFCPNLHPNPPGQAFCGECGNPLMSQADAEIAGKASASRATSAKSQQKAGLGCLLLFLLVAGGCGVLAVVGSSSDSSNSTTSDNGQAVSDDRFGAFDVCKQFVRDRLRAPTTAKWRDPFGDQVFYSGDGAGPIAVTASVDSQNGFGASLRSEYTCTVHREGDRWKLDSLDGLE